MFYNKNINYFLSFIFVAIAGLFIGHSFLHLNAKPQATSLEEFLDLDQAKKEALATLLQKSEIIKADQSFEQAFPKRKTKEELIKDLLYILQQTQEKFTARKANQERWEIAPPSWLDKLDEQESEIIFTTLKCTQAIEPQLKTPDAVCILGALHPTMCLRCSYAEKLINDKIVTTKKLILLTGERYITVDAKVDGDKEAVKKIAQRQNIKKLEELTETNLLVDIYQNSTLNNRLPTLIVNTPCGDLPRPTTESTLTELLKKLKEYPEIKTVLFISNQPYVAYQAAIIKTVLSALNAKIEAEIVGAEYAEKERNPKPKDKISAIVATIGSTLWASAPLALEEQELTIEEPEQIEAFCKLYKNNPTLLKKIKTLCIEKK